MLAEAERRAVAVAQRVRRAVRRQRPAPLPQRGGQWPAAANSTARSLTWSTSDDEGGAACSGAIDRAQHSEEEAELAEPRADPTISFRVVQRMGVVAYPSRTLDPSSPMMRAFLQSGAWEKTVSTIDHRPTLSGQPTDGLACAI